MRRVTMAAFLAAAAMTLPGCIFAVGSRDADEGRRIRLLEERITRAEKSLGIDSGTKP